ncbi:hypothetical protein ACFL4A_01910 [bacterium]
MTKFKLDLEGLRKLGYAVIDIKGHDYQAEKDIYKFMIVSADKHIYTKKVKEFLNLDVDEKIAQDMMQEIYRHKWIESQKQKHDIGLEKAAKDWYENHYNLWKEAKENK